jgi:RNA exonuclease 4
VADLLRDKVLVGHAVFHDLKACPLIINLFLSHLTVFPVQALLLSHPFPFKRDTQQLAYKYKLSNSRYPALRTLTVQEFGIQIQGGEHSSVCFVLRVHHTAARIYVSVQVTDARATMAIYRLHRREWEKGQRLPPPPCEDPDRSGPSRTQKQKHLSVQGVGDLPRGGKKRSAVKRSDPSKTKNTSSLASKKKTGWWSELGSSKGSLRIS